MFDEMVIEIDKRIKYADCNSGDQYGTLSVNFINNKKRITKQVTWSYPSFSEIAALNEMMQFLKSLEHK